MQNLHAVDNLTTNDLLAECEKVVPRIVTRALVGAFFNILPVGRTIPSVFQPFGVLPKLGATQG